MASTDPQTKNVQMRAQSRARVAADVQSLREMTTSLHAKGNSHQAFDVLLGVIESLHRDNERLTYRLATSIRARFGRSSERLTAAQLGQLVLALGGTEEQAAEAAPLVPAPQQPAEDGQQESQPKKSKERRPNHHGRTELSQELKRNITVVPVAADERTCIHCGSQMQCIGHIDHETVELVPASIEVNVERREKLACGACHQDITTAPRQKSEPYQRRAGMSVLAHLLESKCDDALPIYRQQDQLRRLGFDVPLNSLYGYWDYATSLLQPVADAIVSTTLGDPVVGVDDTKLDYLDPGDPRGKQRGHLWCFVGSGGLVGFTFTETWEAKDIEPWISAIDGFIQCDDYKGYGTTIVDDDDTERLLVPLERRLGCMMHVRRRFHRAYLGRHLGAALPLGIIKDIYCVEAEAKTAGLGPEDRLLLRRRAALPLLEQFDSWVDENLPKLLPQGPLGAAARYAKDQRPFIHRCFTDGRFEIDNGRVEREIREPAIGRKNFLFAGSAAAAGRLACAYTVVQSSRRVGIPVREYLIDIMGRIERGWPAKKLTELLPDRWAADRARLLVNEGRGQ